MNLHFFRSIAICAAVACAFVLSSGCKSSPDAGATVASMDDFGVEIAKVKDSIDRTVESLDALVATQSGDIRVNFDEYSKSVAALDKRANVIRKRAEEMKAKGDEFFKEWETPHNMSPARRAELNASYAKIKDDLTAAKAQFTPFLKSLKDTENYLELDLTPNGIRSMADLAKKAKDNGAHVKSSIDAVLDQVNAVRGMLSTK